MNLSGERVVVAALFPARFAGPNDALRALADEVRAAGGVVVGQLLQRRGVSRSPRPGGAAAMDKPLASSTLFGKGKAIELGVLCRETTATAVVFVNTLTKSQVQTLQDITGCRMLDADSIRETP